MADLVRDEIDSVKTFSVSINSGKERVGVVIMRKVIVRGER